MEKKKRNKREYGTTEKCRTGCGSLYVTINIRDKEIFEVFASLGKAGGCAHCQLEALTRSVTLGLRYGVPIEGYFKMFEDIKCPEPTWDDGIQIKSCPDAIARTLERVERELKTGD